MLLPPQQCQPAQQFGVKSLYGWQQQAVPRFMEYVGELFSFFFFISISVQNFFGFHKFVLWPGVMPYVQRVFCDRSKSEGTLCLSEKCKVIRCFLCRSSQVLLVSSSRFILFSPPPSSFSFYLHLLLRLSASLIFSLVSVGKCKKHPHCLYLADNKFGLCCNII